MISLAHASMAHWRERDDATPQNLSIGYWQLSRVYAVIEQADNARHYGQRCLEVSAEEGPFFLGYAHEALTRAARLGGDASAFQLHLQKAKSLAAAIEDVENRQLLEADLAELETA